MDVAILYSGGKDSTLAIEYALEKNWNIKYLISVKPNRNDCYLFHFATVEQTKKMADILGIKHVYTTCSDADPQKEAMIVKNIVEQHPVDSVVLGGIGLQETQIKSIRDALFPLGIDVFASHVGVDHVKLMKEMLIKGYDIIITEVAAEGLGMKWLGEKLTLDNLNEFVKTAEKYGFHPGGEGGPYNTLVVDGPIFSKRLEILSFDKVMEGEFNGYVDVKESKVIDKFISIKS
ncbi:MAG: diphthine--ammonia ligase [Nanoarchaeota archaeon]